MFSSLDVIKFYTFYAHTYGLTFTAVTGQSGHTSAGCLHVFQFIRKPQNGFVILFTLFGQEMKKCRVLTDGFCVSELKERKGKDFPSVIFLSDTQPGAQSMCTPTDLHSMEILTKWMNRMLHFSTLSVFKQKTLCPHMAAATAVEMMWRI